MITRRRLSCLGVTAVAMPLPVARVLAAPARPTIHVSADGDDARDGADSARAVRTFARAHALAQPGCGIKLRRGDTWHERLHVAKDRVSVGAYGTGRNPRIDGDRKRYCLWVSGADAAIADIDCVHGRSGLLIQGIGASASVRGGVFSECGTGISAGGGGKLDWGGVGLGPPVFGRLILAENVTCLRNRTALGAADGIQIGEDATADAVHTIRDATCRFNEWGGVNAKSGTVVVEGCNLSDNGQTGWTAQNNLRLLRISRGLIEGNSAAEQGTPQASVEDSAVVVSRQNTYRNPHNAASDQYTLQIRVVGQPKSRYPQRPALECFRDTFINRVGQTRTLGSIGLHMNDRFPARLSVTNCTFDHADGSGIAIDGYSAPLLDLAIRNNIFSMGDCVALRLHPRTELAGRIDHNLYFGSRALVTIRGRRSYAQSDLRRLFTDHGIEQHAVTGDPLFRNAAVGDYHLTAGSPGLRAGTGNIADHLDTSGRPPDLGAYPSGK